MAGDSPSCYDAKWKSHAPLTDAELDEAVRLIRDPCLDEYKYFNWVENVVGRLVCEVKVGKEMRKRGWR